MMGAFPKSVLDIEGDLVIAKQKILYVWAALFIMVISVARGFGNRRVYGDIWGGRRFWDLPLI